MTEGSSQPVTCDIAVATAGTSVFGGRNLLGGLDRGIKQELVGLIKEAPDEAAERLAAFVGDVGWPAPVTQLDPSDGMTGSLSAEVTGFVRSGIVPSPESPLLLIASDTDEGVLAAVGVGLLLRRPVRLVTELGDLRDLDADQLFDDVGRLLTAAGSMPGTAPAVVVRVPTLNPTSDQAYKAGLQGIAACLIAAARSVEDRGSGPDQRLMFVNLNGGYKASIPHITLLLQFLAARFARVSVHPAALRASVVFNDPNDQRFTFPVEVPITPALLAETTLQDLLQLREGRVASDRFHGSELEGFAWKRDGRHHVQPTPIGAAIADLVHEGLRS